MMITGWLLDVYDDPQEGAVAWLLGDDGRRYRLHQDFPVSFYAAGPNRNLRRLWHFLEEQAASTALEIAPLSVGPSTSAPDEETPFTISLTRQERRDLFCAEPVTVLACQVSQPAALPRLFQLAAQRFPDLTYYDADIPTALRYAAVYKVFPLARCRVEARQDGSINRLEALDTPWDLDPAPAPLRTFDSGARRGPVPRRAEIYIYTHRTGWLTWPARCSPWPGQLPPAARPGPPLPDQSGRDPAPPRS